MLGCAGPVKPSKGEREQSRLVGAIQAKALALFHLEHNGVNHQRDVADQRSVVQRDIGCDGVALLERSASSRSKPFRSSSPHSKAVLFSVRAGHDGSRFDGACPP